MVPWHLALAVAAPRPVAPVAHDGQVVDEAVGLWRDRGYARALHLTHDHVELVDVSDAGCVTTAMSVAELMSVVPRYHRDGDVLMLTDTPQSTRYTLDRIERLPSSCDRALGSSPADVVTYFSAMMRDSYAFFDVYGIDWDDRTRRLRESVSDGLDEATLFERLVESLDGIEDGHLGLDATVDGSPKHHVGLRARVLVPALRAAFAADHKRDPSRYQTRWFFSQKRQMRRRMGRSSTDAAGGNVLYGRLGDVGYLAVYGMGGFGDDDAAMNDELQAVHRIIGEAITALSDTRAMVVDVSLNQGGYDEVGLAIASHFTDQPRFAYTKQPFGQGTPPQAFEVEPARGPRYARPVLLVTSDVTVSAAEVFTLAMRALPSVTHVGATTMGALSDILTKPLPNGWSLDLSHEIYLDHEGTLWEGRGIPPAVPLDLWGSGPLWKSHARVIDELVRTVSRDGLAASTTSDKPGVRR